MFDRFEAYVANTLFTLPLPLRQYAVTIHLHLPILGQNSDPEGSEILKFSLPSRAELPGIDDESISCLFRCLSIETILRCIRYMILDQRQVLIGSNRNDIVHCCVALRSLIYPLKYDHAWNWYTSYIPLRDYGQSAWAFPALIGLDKKLVRVAEVHDVNTWIVDLDTDAIWMSRDHTIQIQRQSDADTAPIPQFPRVPQEILIN